MTRLLIALLAIDATLFALAIAFAIRAQHDSSQDAAGRGMVWVYPVVLGALLLVPLLLWLVRLPMAAAVVAFIPAAIGAMAMLGNLVQMRTRARVASGAVVFADRETRSLAAAIARGDTAKVRQLVAAGAKLDVVAGDEYETLLTWTLAHHPNVARFVIELGADPNFRTVNGQPPLLVAITKRRPAVVRALLDAGADPNTREAVLRSPAIYATVLLGESAIFQLLVDRGADLALLDHDSSTILMHAASAGRWVEAKAALDRGVDPHHVGSEGTTLKSILDTQELSAADLDDHDYRAFIEAVKQRGIVLKRESKPDD